MSAAARLGLHVADHAVEVTTAGDHVFASRRYDRARLDDRWERLHQEDLCQALSVSPDRKYQADGGPGIAQIAILFQDAIRDLESRKRTQERFFEALVFAVAAACTDAHAKNYSLMLRGRSVHLAPLYDLGTHAPYPSTAPLKSAMKIGDEYRIDAIGERELMTAARKLRVPDEWAEERIATICNGLAEAFADAATELDDPFARGVADSVAAIADARGWV